MFEKALRPINTRAGHIPFFMLVDCHKPITTLCQFSLQKLMTLENGLHVVAFFGYSECRMGTSGARVPPSMFPENMLSEWAESVGARLDNKCTFIVQDGTELFALSWYDGQVTITNKVWDVSVVGTKENWRG